VSDWLARRSTSLVALGEAAAARQRAESGGASSEEIASLVDAEVELRSEYVAVLPQAPLARDPFSGVVVTAAIDTAGLDGPFWDAQNPARPVETMAASFVVLSGALSVSPDHVEDTAYLCLPGPAVPFVVPDLLGRDGVEAVLATVPVGAHTGYALSYFSPRPEEQPPLPNEWGRREYWLRSNGEPVHMATSYDEDPAPDFDLGPWIESAKLAWVAPGDGTLQPRHEVEGCPYLDLEGTRRHQRVQFGQVF
jgi:hypothetical protein